MNRTDSSMLAGVQLLREAEQKQGGATPPPWVEAVPIRCVAVTVVILTDYWHCSFRLYVSFHSNSIDLDQL